MPNQQFAKLLQIQSHSPPPRLYLSQPYRLQPPQENRPLRSVHTTQQPPQRARLRETNISLEEQIFSCTNMISIQDAQSQIYTRMRKTYPKEIRDDAELPAHHDACVIYNFSRSH